MILESGLYLGLAQPEVYFCPDIIRGLGILASSINDHWLLYLKKDKSSK